MYNNVKIISTIESRFIMSQWDFLWDLTEDEFLEAQAQGCTNYELDEFDKSIKRKEEQLRIHERNEKWANLKIQRDNKEITAEVFKREKNIIFAVDNKRKKELQGILKKIKKIQKLNIGNRNDIKKDCWCGCCNCGSTLEVSEITSYSDNNTAICPGCNTSTIISRASINNVLSVTIDSEDELASVMAEMTFYLSYNNDITNDNSYYPRWFADYSSK